MSKAGMHNYSHRNVGDAVVRSLAMERDLDRFIDEVGQPPVTPAQAYEMGLEGDLRQWRRKGGRWVVQIVSRAMGLDCLAEYARGTGEAENREEDWHSHFDFRDSGDDRCYGPEDSVLWAFYEVETEKWRQVQDAWGLHDCGFVPASEFPVFLRRATPMEDLLDMEVRIQRASTAMDIRDVERIGRALSGGA